MYTFSARLRDTLTKYIQLARGTDSSSAVALCLVALCLLTVGFAAVFPSGGGDASALGKWKPLVSPVDAARAVLVEYRPDEGSLRLNLDPNETELLASTRNTRFINAHIRKFNKAVAGRSFKRAGMVKGPSDCLFSVSLDKANGGGLYARLVNRDLSVYDMHPAGERGLKNLGPIHFAPDNVKQPYFSDGDLGFFLDPRGAESAIGRPVSLLDEGIFNGKTIVLTDREGNARARVKASSDGHSVSVKPMGEHSVFLENNPPVAGEGVLVTEGQVAEIGGRFFEAHISSAATMAVTRVKGGSIKRVYPMGKLFHIVGPLALDGSHQSLGIEYMLQEYLMGLPESNIPPGELWLTIDERLQAHLAANLNDMAQQSKRGVASAMIMNAQTGAILAMAAQPDGYDPEDREGIIDMLSKGREAYANHGCFRRHVIGSVAKAFTAFLAMEVMGDEVRSFVVDCNAPTTGTLFGHRLYGSRNKAMMIHKHPVTFNDYLIRSDNTYQQTLGLLLLAGVRDPAELPKRWWFKDPKGNIHLRPLSNEGTEPMAAGSLGPSPNRLRVDMNGHFTQLMQEIFDISPYNGEAVVGDRDISIYSEELLKLAGRLLQTRNPNLDDPRSVLVRRSVVCAPETARSELNDLKVTYDATNVLYGANRNRWTDVKMCEAFSRMMTGKKVKARLISRYLDTFSGEIVDLEANSAAPELEVENPGAFAQMRRILERVPKNASAGYPEGTAHKLQSTVDEMASTFPGFRLIGKTGTIDDGSKGDPDSRLFLGSFGITDENGFTDEAYTIVVYLKNAVDQDAHFNFIINQLPQWWQLLQERHETTVTLDATNPRSK